VRWRGGAEASGRYRGRVQREGAEGGCGGRVRREGAEGGCRGRVQREGAEQRKRLERRRGVERHLRARGGSGPHHVIWLV
jgi:hypothetical protein